MQEPAEPDGFVQSMLLTGSDPLAALAAQVGSEEVFPLHENDAVMDEPILEDQEEELQEDPVPSLPFLENVYRKSCSGRQVDVVQSQLEILRDIPESLIHDLNIQATPSGVAGGAAISISQRDGATIVQMPFTEQIDAFMDTITRPGDAHKVLLLDHLDLSGLSISCSSLSRVIDQAVALGPWWRLRSLALSGCNLDISHLQELSKCESQPFLWHLQRLDLSDNKGLGREARGGLRAATQFATPDILMLTRLWRSAPLRYLDLTNTDLSSSALTICLRMLRAYPLPSTAGGCGSALHDGTRPLLECIKLGAGGEGAWSSTLLAELAALVESAPMLTVLELHGAGPAEGDALARVWEETHRKRGVESVQVAEVRPGVIRLAAGAATLNLLPVELPPSGHTLPGPETPKPSANGADLSWEDPCTDMPHILDDWNDRYHGAGEDNENMRMVQDVLRPSVQSNGRGTTLPPRRPQGTTTGTGVRREKNKDGAPQRQRKTGAGGSHRAGGSGVPRSRGPSGGKDRAPARLRTPAADYGPALDYIDDSDDSDEDAEEGDDITLRRSKQPRDPSSQARKRKTGGGGGASHRPVRMYTGGRDEDELPAGGIDIGSDDDDGEYSSNRPRSDDDSDEDEDDYDMRSDDDGIARMDIDDDDDGDDDDEDDRDNVDRGREGKNSREMHPNRQGDGNTAHGNRPTTGQGPATAPTPLENEPVPERFKIPDGTVDMDSKLGRIYRAEAKSFARDIPDPADRKAAKAALNIWDSCAENAWDRHRWDRPSRTQHDEPHVLGQLNKLYDLAQKYGKELGFPFPKWIPGGGPFAFEQPQQAQQQRAIPMPPPPPRRKIPSSADANAAPKPPSSSKRDDVGPVSRLPRTRLVDDGGHGRGSDGEDSDDSGDGFVVPDGHNSDTDKEDDVVIVEERSADVIVLDKSQSQSQSQLALPEVGGPSGTNQVGMRHRAVIADSDDSEEEKQEEDRIQRDASGQAFSPVTSGRKDAAARELARLSAWAWDTRKEVHPRNEQVYGLAAGKRSRRQLMSSSQMVQVLGGSEEQEPRMKVPKEGHRRNNNNNNNEDQITNDQAPSPSLYDYESSSDDDVPLAAQMHRFRTTPASEPRQQDTIGLPPAPQRSPAHEPTPREHESPQELHQAIYTAAIGDDSSPPLQQIMPGTEPILSPATDLEPVVLSLAPPSASPSAKDIETTAPLAIPEVILPVLEQATTPVSLPAIPLVPATEVMAPQPSPKSPAALRAVAAARALLGSLYWSDGGAEPAMDVSETECQPEKDKGVMPPSENGQAPPSHRHISSEALPTASCNPEEEPSILMGVVPNSQEEEDMDML